MNTAWLAILGISVANNLDNAGVGLAYGIARIRIPLLANLWISVIAFLLTGSAALCGSAISHFLPGRLPNILSAIILCGIGVWIMHPFSKKSKPNSPQPLNPDNTLAGSLRRILHDPTHADSDGSQHIDFTESTLLGVALSINNIGGGLSAGLLHLNGLWIALLSAAISFVFICLGSGASRLASLPLVSRYAGVVSGVLLITIGMFELR
jgi:putative sporulation protein YtaF